MIIGKVHSAVRDVLDKEAAVRKLPAAKIITDAVVSFYEHIKENEDWFFWVEKYTALMQGRRDTACFYDSKNKNSDLILSKFCKNNSITASDFIEIAVLWYCDPENKSNHSVRLVFPDLTSSTSSSARIMGEDPLKTFIDVARAIMAATEQLDPNLVPLAHLITAGLQDGKTMQAYGQLFKELSLTAQESTSDCRHGLIILAEYMREFCGGKNL